MKVEIINYNKGQWRAIADAARTTVGKKTGEGEPSPEWKRAILMAEHSPIRLLQVNWKWIDLPSWVSVHFVRHKIGIDHFVRTQRSDRTGVNRNELPQGTHVIHQCSANAQAIIAISRKRLCHQASRETRDAWGLFLLELQPYEPELFRACVPECVYRGFCPEMKCCGFNGTKEYYFDRMMYTGGQSC